MKVIAYLYSDPLLESTPDLTQWGWQIDQIYHDLATGRELTARAGRQGKGNRLSASLTAKPQWQQLLQDCQAEPADCLLVRQLEDLGESVQEVGDRLAELETLGIQLITVDLSTESAENFAHSDRSILQGTDLKAELLKLLQQLQHNQRSRRIQQGHARNRVKALPPPGKAPYGYRRGKSGYVLDRATAPVVKEFFDQFLLYGSLRGAVRHLEKKYNKKISVSTGRRWLTNPTYRGDLEYHNGQVVLDTHTAIISREEAAQIDRLLRRNRRLPPRTASAARSLAGLVGCGACQSPMTITRVSARGKQEYLYVRPTVCPLQPKCRAIPYDQVLQQTIQHICEELPKAVSGVNIPDLDGMKQGMGGAIAQKQAVLAQLPALEASGILDAETAELRAYKLRTEIAELQATLAQLPPVNLQSIAQAVSIPQFWFDLSEAERRFYLREFLRQIQIQRQGEEWQIQLVFIF